MSTVQMQESEARDYLWPSLWRRLVQRYPEAVDTRITFPTHSWKVILSSWKPVLAPAIEEGEWITQVLVEVYGCLDGNRHLATMVRDTVCAFVREGLAPPPSQWCHWMPVFLFWVQGYPEEEDLQHFFKQQRRLYPPPTALCDPCSRLSIERLGHTTKRAVMACMKAGYALMDVTPTATCVDAALRVVLNTASCRRMTVLHARTALRFVASFAYLFDQPSIVDALPSDFIFGWAPGRQIDDLKGARALVREASGMLFYAQLPSGIRRVLLRMVEHALIPYLEEALLPWRELRILLQEACACSTHWSSEWASVEEELTEVIPAQNACWAARKALLCIRECRRREALCRLRVWDMPQLSRRNTPHKRRKLM